MPIVCLYREPRSIRVKVPSAEEPGYIVDRAEPDPAPREYFRTRQHTGDGLRVYAAAVYPWPEHCTLGWAAPRNFRVESDYDATLQLWVVWVRGFGHSIRTYLADGITRADQYDELDAVVERLARATHPHRVRVGGPMP